MAECCETVVTHEVAEVASERAQPGVGHLVAGQVGEVRAGDAADVARRRLLAGVDPQVAAERRAAHGRHAGPNTSGTRSTLCPRSLIGGEGGSHESAER